MLRIKRNEVIKYHKMVVKSYDNGKKQKPHFIKISYNYFTIT
jgi:hypothetical protein